MSDSLLGAGRPPDVPPWEDGETLVAADLGSTDQPLEAVIVGAGFGGIGMAAALLRRGVRDFVVLEKGGEVGGCWRDNSYPGAACDVPSHLYAFSFEPKWDWSRRYAPQSEILAYLKHCARKYGVTRHLRLRTEVVAATWEEMLRLWRVDVLRDGRHEQVHTRLLITATGQLSRPSIPSLPGIERFRGRSFHSARWDHSWPLLGKSVAVVGTGASAVQFVPHVAELASRLTVFQRTPHHVVARPDRPYRAWEQALFRTCPPAQALTRAYWYAAHELRALGFTRWPGLLDLLAGRAARRHLARQVTDPALHDKLIPEHAPGCKRILLSNDYYPSLARSNVELVIDEIAAVTEDGIRTEDGRLHRVDTLIYGTGFVATDFLAPMRITGLGGVELTAWWRDQGARAYLGLSVPRFPNLFMLYGPNTNLGHSSIVYMLESQIAHVMRCHRAMRHANASGVEVIPECFERYNERLQRQIRRTVWNTGCASWYLDAAGRNTVNWPGFTFQYRWQTGRRGLQAYRMIP